jgi:hypothetical protein
MNREQLEHVIRAAAANADTDQIVVVGSQSIHGAHPNLDHPVLCRSMEADVFPLEIPENSVLIDGAIGERSIFHETFGYYAHGVAADTATLPAGWRDRLVPVRNENTRHNTGWCLDPHDLAASKLVAGRPKDVEFLQAMIEFEILDPKILSDRLALTSLNPEKRAVCEAAANRLFQKK